MKTLDINTIAFQYLLRTDSQKNNEKEESKPEVFRLDQEKYAENQSLLFQLYNLEEEDLYV